VYDSGNVSQDCQQDVDQEISTASALEEDTDRWEEDGENDLEDIASCERHLERFLERLMFEKMVIFVDVWYL